MPRTPRRMRERLDELVPHSVPNVYEALKAAKIPLDHHESDLYCLATDLAVALCRRSGRSFHRFRSKVDGRIWLDVPFAYDPWWRKRCRRTDDQVGALAELAGALVNDRRVG